VSRMAELSDYIEVVSSSAFIRDDAAEERACVGIESRRWGRSTRRLRRDRR